MGSIGRSGDTRRGSEAKSRLQSNRTRPKLPQNALPEMQAVVARPHEEPRHGEVEEHVPDIERRRLGLERSAKDIERVGLVVPAWARRRRAGRRAPRARPAARPPSRCRARCRGTTAKAWPRRGLRPPARRARVRGELEIVDEVDRDGAARLGELGEVRGDRLADGGVLGGVETPQGSARESSSDEAPTHAPRGSIGPNRPRPFEVAVVVAGQTRRSIARQSSTMARAGSHSVGILCGVTCTVSVLPAGTLMA